jgi:hypothetical protein
MNLTLDQFPRDGNSNPVSVLVATCHSQLTGRDTYTPLQSTSDGKVMVESVPKSPTIKNWTFPTANTWTQLTPISSGVQTWQMRARTASLLNYNFTSLTPTDYMTLDASTVLKEDTDVGVNGLYVSAGVTGTVVEVETWR